jgi:site-specific recombinase XerD
MTTDPRKYIEDFLQEQDVEDSTKRNYRNILNIWLNWLVLNGITWGEVRKPHILRFKSTTYENGKSPLYVNTCLSIIRKFYRWLDDSGFYPDIASGVKGYKRYVGFRKKPLKPEQVEALLNSIDRATELGKRDHLIIRMMVTSGMRSVEVSRLDIGDFEDGERPGVRILGKGRKEKVFARISLDVADELKAYVGKRISKDFEPMFIYNRYGSERMSPAYIGVMIKHRMVKAGMDDKMLTAHSLRHTTAVMMITEGASLYDVQNQLRHTDANMTRNYLRFIEDEKRHQLTWVDKLETVISKDRQTRLKFLGS